MSKIASNRRLTLSRQTLRWLNPVQLEGVVGGRRSNTDPWVKTDETCASECRPCDTGGGGGGGGGGGQGSGALTCREEGC